MTTNQKILRLTVKEVITMNEKKLLTKEIQKRQTAEKALKDILRTIREDIPIDIDPRVLNLYLKVTNCAENALQRMQNIKPQFSFWRRLFSFFF